MASLIQNPDSSYISLMYEVDSTGRNQRIKLAKLNKKGDIEWPKFYKVKKYATVPGKIKKTKDGYLIAGEFYNRDSALSIIKSFVLKVDFNGDSLWLKEYEMPPTWTRIYNLLVLPNQNILLIGYCVKFTKVNNEYIEKPWTTCIIKTDSIGNILWQKEYSNVNYSIVPSDFVELSNKDLLIAGRTVQNGGIFDIAPMLMRVNQNGEQKWLKRYGQGGLDEAFVKIVAIDSNQFILSGGYTKAFQNTGRGTILSKIDANGKVVWFKKYSAELDEIACQGGHVITEDGKITIAGINYEKNDVGIAQFDSNGAFKWYRKYDLHPQSEEWISGIIATNDEGFAMFGHGLSPTTGNDQAWLLKMDKYGCLVKGCEGIIATDDEVSEEKNELLVFPNPNNGIATISWGIGDESYKEGRIEIIDVAGKVLKVIDFQQVEGNISLDMPEAAAGLYFLKLKIGAKVFVRKFIIIR